MIGVEDDDFVFHGEEAVVIKLHKEDQSSTCIFKTLVGTYVDRAGRSRAKLINALLPFIVPISHSRD